MIDNITHRAEKLELFSSLPEDLRKECIRAARGREAARGANIFLHGDNSAAFFIVVSGAVRIFRQTPDGKDVTLHIAIAGDMLGEHELFESKGHFQSNASAMEDSLLLEYPARWIKDKMLSNAELSLAMLASVSRTGSRVALDKEHLFTLKGPQRIGCFLMRLCALHELDPKDFTLPYTKAIIASSLAMEPESFSRALAKLKEAGVHVSGNEVSIENIIRLNDYVCSACSVSADCDICANLTHSCAAPCTHANLA